MTIFSKRYANDPCHAIEMQDGLTVQMREHERLGFTLEEYKRRYEHVLANMKDAGVDVLAIRSPENICYLTGHETPGYYGYHCLLVSAHEEPVLIVRRIEEINAPEFSWLTRTVPVEDYQHPFEFVIEELRRIGADDKRIGVEKGMGHERRCHEKRGFMFTVAEYEALTTALPNATFVDSEGIVENARVVKSDAEVEMMRRAARIADKALLAGIEATRAWRDRERCRCGDLLRVVQERRGVHGPAEFHPLRGRVKRFATPRGAVAQSSRAIRYSSRSRRRSSATAAPSCGLPTWVNRRSAYLKWTRSPGKPLSWR